MPYGDRTGPLGQGPMTGRGAGYCAGNNMPGSASPGFGFGRRGGWGRGGGFGFRHNNYGLFGGWRAGWNAPGSVAPPTAEQERTVLKNQADALKTSLENIERRLRELDENKND